MTFILSEFCVKIYEEVFSFVNRNMSFSLTVKNIKYGKKYVLFQIMYCDIDLHLIFLRSCFMGFGASLNVWWSCLIK